MQVNRLGDKRSASPSLQVKDAEEKRIRIELEDSDVKSKAMDCVAKEDHSVVNKNKKLVKGARKRRRKLENIEPYSHDDVYWHEICDLLGKDAVQSAVEQETDLDSPFELKEEVELEVQKISSNGESFVVMSLQTY